MKTLMRELKVANLCHTAVLLTVYPTNTSKDTWHVHSHRKGCGSVVDLLMGISKSVGTVTKQIVLIYISL